MFFKSRRPLASSAATGKAETAIRRTMTLLDARTGRVILTILMVAAALAFVWAAWRVLVAFLFAIFFAYLVAPVVQLLMRSLKLSRVSAIATVYLLIFVGLAVLFLFIGPDIQHDAEKLTDTLPNLYQKIATGQIAWQLGAEHGWSYESRRRIQMLLAAHSGEIDSAARGGAARLAHLGGNAWWLVLIPVLAVFFLKDGDRFRQTALRMFERPNHREFIEGAIDNVHQMLAYYIRSQIIMAALSTAAYVTGLNLLRTPYATVLSVVSGFLEFIPIVGPPISSILITGVALGSGYRHLISLLLFLAIWRGIQDYVNAPHIMGKQLRLHPLAVVFGVLAGAEVGGIIGVYLSIPVMVTTRIFWRRWQAYVHQAALDELAPFPEPIEPEKTKSA